MPKAPAKKTAKVQKRGKKGKNNPDRTRFHASNRSTRSNKSDKDPNAPKRGLSAYMFFANEQRENVREENPGISFGTLRNTPPS